MSVAGQPPFPQPGDAPAGPSRRQRLRAPLLTAGVVGASTLALHLRDPHVSGSWGGCPWLALTGHYCPGCGGLRAVNDLTHLDVLAAASSNLLFVLAVPVLLLWWLRWTRREWSGTRSAAHSVGQASVQGPPVRARRSTGAWIAAVVVLVVAFSVLRNLAWGSWLAP